MTSHQAYLSLVQSLARASYKQREHHFTAFWTNLVYQLLGATKQDSEDLTMEEMQIIHSKLIDRQMELLQQWDPIVTNKGKKVEGVA